MKFHYSFAIVLISSIVFNTSYANQNTRQLFPITPHVSKQVEFWTKIFYNYPSHTVILHDLERPDYIIDVIDFKSWQKNNQLSQYPNRSLRNQIIKQYTNRYELAVKRFKKYSLNALKFGAIEKRIFTVYRKSKSTLSSLKRGHIRFRSQQGLSDEFIKAAHRAKKFLPYMENEFKQIGVPAEISRLAFVESMFNVNARSKVGASGIWQFMPRTAKEFLKMNTIIDERNSPYKATKAAAKLLKRNFEQLQSWPLAITAYNHGVNGMRKAIQKVGSKNLDLVINHYKSRSFRYASKNFYSEFLAAKDVYDALLRNKRLNLDNEKKNGIDSLVLNGNISVDQLIKHTPLDKQTIQNNNLCLKKKVFTSYKNRKLPRYFEIFMPTNLLGKVKIALQKFRNKRYATNR